MTLRSGHGAGTGVPRIEVLPPDELPVGIPADTGPANRADFGAGGRFTPGNTIAAEGGKSKAGKTRLASRLSLGGAFKDPRFEPYARAANAWRIEQCRQLSQLHGAGYCGPGPSSVVASAALQLAASRFAFEVLGDLQLGSRLANDSRQNLLAAHELVCRDAKARPPTAERELRLDEIPEAYRPVPRKDPT